MSTLLTVNEKAALIGEYDGSARTAMLPLKDYCEEPAHTSKDAEYIGGPRAGALEPTDTPTRSILHVSEEKIAVKTYADAANGLSVRAAFDPRTHLWVVADLETDAESE